MDAIACHATVPPTPRAASVARHLVTGCLDRVLDGARLADAELAVSELVTNSVLHAGLHPGQPIGVEILCDPRTTRVDVVDAGPGFPHSPVPALPAEGRLSGRGLAIVSRVADRWGYRGEPATRVWFEIDHDARDGDVRRGAPPAGG